MFLDLLILCFLFLWFINFCPSICYFFTSTEFKLSLFFFFWSSWIAWLNHLLTPLQKFWWILELWIPLAGLLSLCTTERRRQPKSRELEVNGKHYKRQQTTQNIIRDHCKSLYSITLENKKQIDQFLDSSKFSQEEISNLNRPMTNKETESVTERLWGQACVRSIPAWRSREVILLNFKLWRWSLDSPLRNLKIWDSVVIR